MGAWKLPGLVDAWGNPVNGRVSKLLDPSQKIFVGPITVKFYNDRLVAIGTCFHCKSRIEVQKHLSPGEARQVDRDPQYRKNLFDFAGDELQNKHQCGLIRDGWDVIDDVWKGIERR